MGDVIRGFGLLFMGLDFLTKSMPALGNPFDIISVVSNLGFVSSQIGAGAGLLMTLITHSSSASTAIMLTIAFNGVVGYEIAAVTALITELKQKEEYADEMREGLIAFLMKCAHEHLNFRTKRRVS